MGETRPRDWEPLTDDGRDPVPGDWEAVKEAAARYRRTATMINDCRHLLQELGSDDEGWKGASGDAVREKATDLADSIARVHGRYNAAANALAGYWPALKDAQEESLELHEQAVAAQGDIDTYGPKAEAAEDEDAEDHDRHQEYSDALSEAQGALSRARTRLEQVVKDKNTAAQAAADALGDFIGSDGMKDGWSDRFKTALDAVKKALINIGEIAGIVAAIAGVLALCVGWIPVIGQALAGVLGVIALVATCLSLVANILKGNWLGVALDVVGILTFGIGRAAGAGIKAAANSSKWTAFRSLRGQMAFGNRAARVARAETIMAGSTNQLRHAAMSTSMPSGLAGWGRAAWGNLLGTRTADVAADATMLRYAASEGADIGTDFSRVNAALTGSDWGSNASLAGTWATQINFGAPLSTWDNPVSGDATPVGGFRYSEEEAEPYLVCVP